MTCPLILASRSPRRKELLRSAGYSFTCMDADIDETARSGECPDQLVSRLAMLKAEAVRRLRPDCIILGADTVVTLDGKIYGKPADMQEAEAMLRHFSGRTQKVLTGICVLHPAKERFLRCVVSEITFRQLTTDIIRKYLSLVNPLDKAGAYGIQCRGEMIISGLEGSLTNVIGLPVEELPVWLPEEASGFSPDSASAGRIFPVAE